VLRFRGPPTHERLREALNNCIGKWVHAVIRLASRASRVIAACSFKMQPSLHVRGVELP
jgi:hypothetical protein